MVDAADVLPGAAFCQGPVLYEPAMALVKAVFDRARNDALSGSREAAAWYDSSDFVYWATMVGIDVDAARKSIREQIAAREREEIEKIEKEQDQIGLIS